MSDPISIPDRYKRNFNTLMRAALDDNLVLLSGVRKSDNACVMIVCAVNRPTKEEFQFVPLAVMCEGNPYEDFRIHALDEVAPGIKNNSTINKEAGNENL